LTIGNATKLSLLNANGFVGSAECADHAGRLPREKTEEISTAKGTKDAKKSGMKNDRSSLSSFSRI
jgi:hypothetical protein